MISDRVNEILTTSQTKCNMEDDDDIIVVVVVVVIIISAM